MHTRTKAVICAAAAYMLLSMMAMIIQSRKRKRGARTMGITYGPLDENEEEGLIGAFNKVGDKLATAIAQVAKSDNELPEDLFDSVNSLPGFTELQISMYYAHLVANPLMAKAFYNLPSDHKLNWVTMFVSEKFPGQ